MKHLRIFTLLAVCAFALSAFAQQTPPADTHEGHGQGHGHSMGHGQGMECRPWTRWSRRCRKDSASLTTRNLKVRKIAEDTHTKMEAMNADKSMSREDRMAKMRSMHDDAMAQVKTILNDDQKKKLDEWQKEMHDHNRMHEKKKGDKGSQTDDPVQK